MTVSRLITHSTHFTDVPRMNFISINHDKTLERNIIVHISEPSPKVLLKLIFHRFEVERLFRKTIPSVY